MWKPRPKAITKTNMMRRNLSMVKPTSLNMRMKMPRDGSCWK